MNIRHLLFKYTNMIILAVFVLTAALLIPDFFTLRNVLNVVRQMSVLGMLALGMSFVVLAGSMDLSVGAVMTFTGLIAISFQDMMPAGPSISAALLAGVLIGLTNGLIVVLTKANSGESLMITLGTQMILMAASLVYTKGFALNGSSSAFYNSIGTGMLWKIIPVPVAILGCMALGLSLLENKTRLGRSIHMTGYNSEACRLSGINTGKIKIFCYGISGFMAACAAIILSSRTLGATPTAGTGYEMDAIVAIVMGGTSLSGGVGSIGKTLIGILTLGVLGNTMNLLGFQASDQMLVKGAVLIFAVFADVWNRKQLVKA